MTKPATSRSRKTATLQARKVGVEYATASEYRALSQRQRAEERLTLESFPATVYQSTRTRERQT